MKEIEWIKPWEPVSQSAGNLNVELQKEISPQHPLHGHAAQAMGRRADCDDALFLLDDGTLAVVHLTWSGRQDMDPKVPWTTQYQSIDEFVEKTMLPDAREYGSLA